ncbi:MAG: hypothetical protein V2I43_08490 [Parvularcula sp.]|jgi:hypothetical protein|nr:hypothetical protein [Parvularcula sp.]
MTNLIQSLAPRSALKQLETAQKKQNQPFGILTGGGRAISQAGGVYFAVSGSLRSEASVVKGLKDSLGTAHATVASAQGGSRAMSGLLNEVADIIAAVEAGAPGTGFSARFGRLAETQSMIMARAEVKGTNLLREGDTLSVTMGMANGYDFKQVSFEAIGLSPTEAAKLGRTETRVVTEDVTSEVTRRDRLESSIERLTERLERLDAREERLTPRLENIAVRETKLTERLETLTRAEQRLNDRLEAAGARPTDPKDQKTLEQARDMKAKADAKFAEGNDAAGSALRKVADKKALDAGLTITLDKLERMERRLERVETRIEKTDARVQRLDERREIIAERLIQVEERREILSERLEKRTERLANLSEEQLGKVVGTKTETVTRTVEVRTESEAAAAFGDLISLVQEKLKAGDTEGAKALVEEGRARIEQANRQLDQIGGAIGRRDGFFGEIGERLQRSLRIKVENDLDEDAALARAAAMLSDLAKLKGLFSDTNARPALTALFESKAQTDEPKKQTEQDKVKEEA